MFIKEELHGNRVHHTGPKHKITQSNERLYSVHQKDCLHISYTTETVLEFTLDHFHM